MVIATDYAFLRIGMKIVKHCPLSTGQMDSSEVRMSKWVIRTDTAARLVGQPMECSDPDAMESAGGIPTIDECVQRLVAPDEIALGHTFKRPVMKGAKLVAFIEIRNSPP